LCGPLLTDSAPEAAGVDDSSFLSFGFALAKELNKLPLSFFAGAAFSAGFVDKVFWHCTGLVSDRSSFISGLLCCESDCAGRFAGMVLEGAGGGGGGRTPVLLCSNIELALRGLGMFGDVHPYLDILVLNHTPLFPILHGILLGVGNKHLPGHIGKNIQILK
jgi:hypothetical protein